MLTSWHTVLEIALRTSAVYVLVLLGIRLTGKREVGQMTPFDLTLLLLLSNSVQNAMTGPDNSLAGGVTAALVLLTLNFLLAEVSGLNRRFRRFIQGSPTLLIHNGQCITPHMAKEHISMDELERALREHGVSCVGEAALAVLEVDGSISVLKYDDVPGHARPQKRLKFLHRN
ncbi:MAG TPA: YetF domain-containing protein [Candidatus Angelobacter sp.]|nr:YetF domain-containing protein [Candidatus Angelobacter sp.]